MSTRSLICMEVDDNKFATIYCHSDGYLMHNGALLVDCYQDRKKVEELIALGDISLLQENVKPDPKTEHSFEYGKRQEGVVVAYHRDRGEDLCENRIWDLVNIVNNPMTEYVYMYGKDNKWRYLDSPFNKINNYNVKIKKMEDIKKIKFVKDGLKQEYAALGFPRPEGYYGYFNDAAIEQLKEEYVQKQKKKTSQEEM